MSRMIRDRIADWSWRQDWDAICWNFLLFFVVVWGIGVVLLVAALLVRP